MWRLSLTSSSSRLVSVLQPSEALPVSQLSPQQVDSLLLPFVAVPPLPCPLAFCLSPKSLFLLLPQQFFLFSFSQLFEAVPSPPFFAPNLVDPFLIFVVI
jgi:hypothetical protein